MNRKHVRNKSAEKTGREKLSERISRRFDVPIDGISNVGVIEIKGDGEMLITGCSSILEYNTDTIVIKTGNKIVKISGNRLNMMTFSNNSTKVGGKIHAIYPDYKLTGEIGEAE